MAIMRAVMAATLRAWLALLAFPALYAARLRLGREPGAAGEPAAPQPQVT